MPIRGINGLPGSGKTLFLTRAMYRVRKARPGRKIVANYPLYLPYGEPVLFADSFEDVADVRECELCLDEMHLWMGARDWKEHGKDAAQFFSQLRKRDVNLWYTTQDLSSVDKLVRARTEISYWLTSYRLFGFMWWDGFFGCNPTPKNKYVSGWYFIGEKLFKLYETTYEVKL